MKPALACTFRLLSAAAVLMLAWPVKGAEVVGQTKPCDVVLSWDSNDSAAQFGPHTPGTKTAGWQEAIAYCVANGRDLYVKGGWGGRKAVYHVEDTIRVPATQDFRIDGGVYVINWTGPAEDPSKDLLVIDSTMNAEYHFGILVYGGSGAAMRIKPENPVPIDGFPVFIETEIKSQGIADPHPFQPGERKTGTGLVLDGSKAPIVCSRFDFIGGILNFKTCVETLGMFVQNHFSCLHLHTNADRSTLFRLGADTTQNVIAVTIGVDMGAADVKGIEVLGRNNTLQVITRGGFPRGHDIILHAAADGNRIDLIQGKPVFDPLDFVTDHAEKATNQLTWTGGTIAPATIKATPGGFSYTQRLFPASALILGGHVSEVRRVRGVHSLTYPLPLVGEILLSVGDQLHIVSTDPLDVHVTPIKVK